MNFFSPVWAVIRNLTNTTICLTRSSPAQICDQLLLRSLTKLR